MIETIVHGDNMPTVKATNAEWKCPDTDGAIFEKCRYLWQRIEHEGFPVTMRHLHGHKGHPGNEAADSVAKHFANSKDIYDGKRTNLAKKIAMHPDLERLWWTTSSRALPCLGSERFFSKGNESCLTCQDYEEPKERGELSNIMLTMATVNVFSSLEKDAKMVSRRKAMAKQADDLGWKIVALQETRYRMSIYKKDNLFHMYTASATKSGQFGCEIWIAKNWDVAGRKVLERDIHVLVEEPTMLAIAMNHPAMKADFICVHAPQRQHEGQERWWRKLQDFVNTRMRKGRKVFILGDMNARVGSCQAKGIGRLFAQEECANGRCLRRLLEDCEMLLPSTFHDFHQGSSHTFQRHRLDYIAIPLAMAEDVQKSEVDENFDMLHGKDDHHPLVVHISFMVQQKCEKRGPMYDKKKASDPGSKEIIEGIFRSFKEPDWEVSTDDHSRALTEHIHEKLCNAFPCVQSRNKPRQPYIQGHLWSLVMERKKNRLDIKWHRRQQREALMKRCWAIWRNNKQQEKEARYHEVIIGNYIGFLYEVLGNSNKRIQSMVKRDKLMGLQETLRDLEQAFRTRNNKQIYEALKPYQRQDAKKRLKTPKPLPYLIGDNGVVENREEWHEAWENHWAQIEGAIIKPWEEHQKDVINSQVNLECSRKEILDATPTLLMVENAVRGIKRGKAGGIDDICPDAVKNGGPAAARCIFTLAAKELVRGQVPFLDKGGIALPLYKHKGPQSSRSSFRSIVLENCIGKTISRLWRPELEKAFRSMSCSSQGGAKRGMGPVTHILRLRVLQRRAFKAGDSYGIILLDMESAFYKAVRQLVVKSDTFEPTDEYAAHVSRTLGIGPEEHKIFYQHLMDEAMLEQGKTNRAVQKWVLSSMEGSWCKMRESTRCLATTLGTKPGDPTADVLYSLVMTKFLTRVQCEFQNREDLKDCVNTMTWVDDVVLPFQCGAREILGKTGRILEVLHDTATSLGMLPSLKKGKTEVIVGFGGSGAQGIKRGFERREPLIYFQTKRGQKVIEAVSEATYLGAILDARGRLMPEIVSCTTRAHSSVRPLTKAALSNDNIHIHQRKAITQSLALSKSCYTIGTWMPMRRSEEKAWRTRTMKTLRLNISHRWKADGHISDEEVLVKCGFISPEEMIETATMRLCSMLAQWADQNYLIPFIHGDTNEDGTWMAYAMEKLNAMSRKVNTQWPQFQNFEEAMKCLRSTKAQHNMNRYINRYSKALLHEREHKWLIGQRFPKKIPMVQREKEEDEGDVPCPECNKSFKSKAAMGVHRNKIHGYFCEAYRYAATTTCYACLGQYFSRERLVQHLQWGSMDCLGQIKNMIEPLTRQQILYLNERDKDQYKETKKQGRRHRNQTRTFCREAIDDITDATGDWDDFFGRENMDENERRELDALEDWGVNGPLLDLWENLPNPDVLEKYYDLILEKANEVQSAKVMLLWIDMIQQDLAAAHDDEPLRGECLATWALVRSRLLERFQ